MMLVAIDTSSDMSGVALYGAAGLLAQTQWQSGRRHSEQVLAQLDHLCRLCDVAPASVTHVAVSVGPGSWSGIRVGISIAKGLAIANDIPVIGVSTLDLLAWPWRGTQAISAALSLGRGRLAIAHYPATAWIPGSISAHNTPLSQCTPALFGTALCCDTRVWDQLALPVTHHLPHHVTPALLATVALQTPASHAPVAPIYLGDPVQATPSI